MVAFNIGSKEFLEWKQAELVLFMVPREKNPAPTTQDNMKYEISFLVLNNNHNHDQDFCNGVRKKIEKRSRLLSANFDQAVELLQTELSGGAAFKLQLFSKTLASIS